MSATDTRIPIAIVGLNFGRHIVGQILAGSGVPHVRLAALCDIDRDRAEAIAQKLPPAHPPVPIHTDIQPILDNPAIPAIGLFTGPVGRAALIRQIIHAGKDVLTTKPFEADPDAALAILREARVLGRVIHLNSPAPLPVPDIAQIRRWHREYNLGAPIAVRAETYAHYREHPDGTWYDDPQKCPAAPIFRLGIYLINDLIQLFGPVVETHILQTRLFTKRPTTDNAQLSLRFENGALGNIFASFCINDGDHYRNTLALNYENGTIYRNCGPGRAGAKSELALVMQRDGRREIIARVEVGGGSGAYQWETFARAVRRELSPDSPDLVTPEQITAGLRVIQAITKQSQ
ncbi:MAG: Gfo/Idh/MocA family oxidoreductase [Opitutaceae bacterium]|jgi:predicted dehydrogenase|nr:Gfo/Idh/MocA family oxidoreductase [Opitutaceae bacterium]